MVEKFDRREPLIQEVLTLIARVGYDSFSFADLSAASGITKASVHHYFRTKEDAALAALQRFWHDVSMDFEALYALPPGQALPTFLAKFKERNWSGKICPVSSLQAEFSVLPQRLQAALQAHTRWEVDQFVRLLDHHANACQQRLRYPAVQCAQILLSAMKGSLQYGRTLGESWLASVIDGSLAGLFES